MVRRHFFVFGGPIFSVPSPDHFSHRRIRISPPARSTSRTRRTTASPHRQPVPARNRRRADSAGGRSRRGRLLGVGQAHNLGVVFVGVVVDLHASSLGEANALGRVGGQKALSLQRPSSPASRPRWFSRLLLE